MCDILIVEYQEIVGHILKSVHAIFLKYFKVV
jgi:hypothetical protein